MRIKNDPSLVKNNTVFFINHFMEYIAKTILELCLKNLLKKKFTNNTILSSFIAEMLHKLNKETILGDVAHSIEFRFLYSSYIKNYFLSIAHELAASYEEQLALLKLSDDGVIRFAYCIAECSLDMLTKTSKHNIFINQDIYPLEKPLLKTLFVLAAVTNAVKFNSTKQLALIDDQMISVSKFIKGMGVRHQTKNEFEEICYQYYIPVKKKIGEITFGFRNSFYNEVIDHNIYYPINLPNNFLCQQPNIIFATIEDINKYLELFRKSKFPNMDGVDSFLNYMLNTYFQVNKNFIVYCTQLNFQDFDMNRANFNGVIFNRCNFNNVDLTQARFIGCTIFDSQFRGTILYDTKFDHSKLNFIDLKLAQFGTGNSFSNSMMQFANLEGLSLNNANFNSVDLTGANHIETNFYQADIRSVLFNASISVSSYLKKKQEDYGKIVMEDLPFQPYLVNQPLLCKDVFSLMSVLFNNETLVGSDNLITVDNSLLSSIAYGIHAKGESKKLLNEAIYSGNKKNRKNAEHFFLKTLNDIEKINIIPQLLTLDELSNWQHEKFMLNISDKSIEQLDEYATILSQAIFNYDSLNFTSLKFYELKQEALSEKEKKPAPNLNALKEFFDKLRYQVSQDILCATSDASRFKVLQLYIYTAMKLCNNPSIDLQGAFSIIQTLSDYPIYLKELTSLDGELLKKLLQYINPFKNFFNLRQLMTRHTIPFLPILTKDIIMSMEIASESYLEQILTLGRFQEEMLERQTAINQIKKSPNFMNIIPDFISVINKINLNEMLLCFNPVIKAQEINETKMESPVSKASLRNKRRLSTKDLSKFFVKKEDPSKEEPSNDAQLKQEELESSSPKIAGAKF